MPDSVLGVTDGAENTASRISALMGLLPSHEETDNKQANKTQKNNKSWLGAKWRIKTG